MDDVLLLTSAQVGRLIGRTAKTLANWRLEGRGPAWIVDRATGRFVGYRPADVQAWIESGRTEKVAAS